MVKVWQVTLITNNNEHKLTSCTSFISYYNAIKYISDRLKYLNEPIVHLEPIMVDEIEYCKDYNN